MLNSPAQDSELPGKKQPTTSLQKFTIDDGHLQSNSSSEVSRLPYEGHLVLIRHAWCTKYTTSKGIDGKLIAICQRHAPLKQPSTPLAWANHALRDLQTDRQVKNSHWSRQPSLSSLFHSDLHPYFPLHLFPSCSSCQSMFERFRAIAMPSAPTTVPSGSLNSPALLGSSDQQAAVWSTSWNFEKYAQSFSSLIHFLRMPSHTTIPSMKWGSIGPSLHPDSNAHAQPPSHWNRTMLFDFAPWVNLRQLAQNSDPVGQPCLLYLVQMSDFQVRY